MKCSNLLFASPRVLTSGRGSLGCCHQHRRGGGGGGRGHRYGQQQGGGHGYCQQNRRGAHNQNRMCDDIFSDVTPVDLNVNDAGKAKLLHMVEEEKMAHDVYARFHDKFQMRIFHNIGGAEEHHRDLVKQALNLHGIPDPTEGKGLGEFDNSEVQALHDEMVANGLEGLPVALRVGAKIEEMDIHDLQNARRDTSAPHLIKLFERLQCASENHLRAFVRVLGNIGETPYEPVILSKVEFEEIVY